MPIIQSVITEEKKGHEKNTTKILFGFAYFHLILLLLLVLITKNIDEPKRELLKKCHLVQVHANKTESQKLSNASGYTWFMCIR